jgi:CcmD family protein
MAADTSVPWMIAAYVVAFVLLGGYTLRLVLARSRALRDGGRARNR